MKRHVALFLTVFLLNARAGTLLLTGGTNALIIPAGKAALFTGSFGGDCGRGGPFGTNPCGRVVVIASVQTAGSVFENFYIGDPYNGVFNNPVVAGPATVTFTNSNAAVTYRFVTGVSSVLLQPQQSRTIFVPAGKSLKSIYTFDGFGNVESEVWRIRITQNGRTVDVPYGRRGKDDLSGPMTVEVINSATTAGVLVYTIFRPTTKLP